MPFPKSSGRNHREEGTTLAISKQMEGNCSTRETARRGKLLDIPDTKALEDLRASNKTPCACDLWG